MAKINAGTTFSTANSTVAQLPAGSTLKVLGNGKVEVVSVPAPKFGDTVTDSKGRTGKVVRLSNRGDFSLSRPLMVGADGVVRNIN